MYPRNVFWLVATVDALNEQQLLIYNLQAKLQASLREKDRYIHIKKVCFLNSKHFCIDLDVCIYLDCFRIIDELKSAVDVRETRIKVNSLQLFISFKNFQRNGCPVNLSDLGDGIFRLSLHRLCNRRDVKRIRNSTFPYSSIKEHPEV